MTSIKSILFLVLSLSLLCACTTDGGVKLPGVYRIDIQQGNVIEQDMVDKLKPGMDKNQVHFILGTPAIIDPFHNEQWEYLFTMSKSGATREQRRLRIHFKDEKLAFIDGNTITTNRIPDDTPRQTKTVEVPPNSGRGKGFFRRMFEALPFVGDDRPAPKVDKSAEKQDSTKTP
jgi:outer membrane protein assembly factor BamE